MFKLFKTKEYTNEELLSALTDDGIAVTEQDVQNVRENDKETLYQIGEAYYAKKNHKKAFAWFHRAALQGHVDAEARVGEMYRKGRGVPKDEKQAMDWLKKAAATGNARALFHIGGLYYTGLFRSEDSYNQAIDWYLKAADNGSAEAMNRLGFMYQSGIHVDKNIPTAVEWHTKAATQGHAGSQYKLGEIYEYQNEFKDLQQAVNWYQKALDRYHSWAEDKVEKMHKKGYYAKEEEEQKEQQDKEDDHVADLSSNKTEMIDQKVQDEPNHSRDIVESGADVKEKELKMRIQVLQKESDLREKERHLKNEENKQLREEVANLKALLQDNAMNDIYYDSDNEDNKKDTSHATGSEKRVERKSESVTHQSKVIVNSDRNSVDLNYDSDENCADPNDDSDNHYADPYYDSSDSEGHR